MSEALSATACSSRIHVVVLAACLLLAFTGCRARDDHHAAGPVVGEPDAKAVEAADPTALTEVSTRDVLALVGARDGRPLLLHLWASWCAPCRAEWPALQRLAARFGPRGVDVVLLAVDLPSSRAELDAFLRAQPPSGRVLWWRDTDADALTNGLGGGWTGELPVTYVFDGSARPVARHFQVVSTEHLARELEEALREARDDVGPGLRMAGGGAPGAGPTPPPSIGLPALSARLQRPPRKLLLLNVWAAWCQDCRAEWPTLATIANAHRAAGLDVLALSIDERDDGEALSAFLQADPPPFPVLWFDGDVEALAKFLDPRWDRSIPASFVYDGAGTQVFSFVGVMDADAMGSVVERLLEGKDDDLTP